jgi:1,4-alpha-glucan branching enzyme
MPAEALDPKIVLKNDGYLEPNIPAIVHRHDVFRKWKDTIDEYEGGYDNFTKGYLKFGLNVGSNGEVVYREWAPNAKEACLIGDFSKSHLWPFHRSTLNVRQTNGTGRRIP